MLVETVGHAMEKNKLPNAGTFLKMNFGGSEEEEEEGKSWIKC